MSFAVPIGPVAGATPAPPTRSGGFALDKAACEAKLADWTHCVSASTPEGKARIRALTDQLQGIDASIAKAARQAQAASDEALPNEPRSSAPTDTLGNVVDLYV